MSASDITQCTVLGHELNFTAQAMLDSQRILDNRGSGAKPVKIIGAHVMCQLHCMASTLIHLDTQRELELLAEDGQPKLIAAVTGTLANQDPIVVHRVFWVDT